MGGDLVGKAVVPVQRLDDGHHREQKRGRHETRRTQRRGSGRT
jgi:hypothetical protein